MHVFFEGVAKSQWAHTLYLVTRVVKWTTPEELQKRFNEFRYPKDKPLSRPGFLPKKVFQGRGGKGRGRSRGRGRGRTGRARPPVAEAEPAAAAPAAAGPVGPQPHKDTTVPYTAHHMLVISMYSIELLRPFLPENAMDPTVAEFAFWRSWVSLAKAISGLLAPSFTWQSLLALQETIVSWQEEFDKVPQYKDFWVPKFHWLMHTALDIWKFGPPRLNWCFNYEAKNQPLKRGCKKGNFKNPQQTTMRFWCESSDHLLRTQTAEHRPEIECGAAIEVGPAAQFPQWAAQLEYLSQILPEPANGPHIFEMLRSVTVHHQQISHYSYAQVELKIDEDAMEDGPQSYLVHIDQIIAMGPHIYLCVTIFDPQVLKSFDSHGVLSISNEALQHSIDQRLESLDELRISPMWHIWDGVSRRYKFIAKW